MCVLGSEVFFQPEALVTSEKCSSDCRVLPTCLPRRQMIDPAFSLLHVKQTSASWGHQGAPGLKSVFTPPPAPPGKPAVHTLRPGTATRPRQHRGWGQPRPAQQGEEQSGCRDTSKLTAFKLLIRMLPLVPSPLGLTFQDPDSRIRMPKNTYINNLSKR